MDLGDGGGSERLNSEIIEPGFNGQPAHRLFDLLFSQFAIERCDAILQQRQLIGDLRREQIAAGGEHLAELNPHRAQLLQRQA